MNSHIEQYINYYAKLSTAPEYALLITGSWGCGKTFLVNKCIKNIENNNKEIKFLPISLYGVTCVNDIESKFFQILNPKLSSKKMILASKLVKGLIKGALKVDLDDDGKSDGSLSINIPDINLKNYLVNTEDSILIFDDLERCSMPLVDLLGYINYFVEKDGYKVILIGDEKKIDNNQNSNSIGSYSSIKEKLVGKTIEVTADVGDSFNFFLKMIKNKLNSFLNENKEIVLDIFKLAKYNNLRSLRKSMLDFERLWNILDKSTLEKQDLLQHLLKVHTIITLEIYSSTIKGSELNQILEGADMFRVLEKTNNKENSKYDIISIKYEAYQTQMMSPLLPVKLWAEITEKGWLNKKEINQVIKKTHYFYDEFTPVWRKLWDYRLLEDSEFQSLIKEALKMFDNREYLELGVIRHIIGLFLFFNKYNLLENFTSNNLNINFEKYIDDIFDSKNININDNSKELTDYDGLGFFEKDNPMFLQANKYLDEKINLQREINLQEKADNLLSLLGRDVPNFLNLIKNHEYKITPILHLINAQSFISAFNYQINLHKHQISYTLYYRFTGDFSRFLVKEQDWLSSIINLLKKEVNKHEGKLSYIIYKKAISKLENGLEILTSHIKV